jgi:hypothetical protein
MGAMRGAMRGNERQLPLLALQGGFERPLSNGDTVGRPLRAGACQNLLDL